MQHLTIAPKEKWISSHVARVAEFMSVEGTATGMVSIALLDCEKRELMAGHPWGPQQSFDFGTPMRPTLPFYVTIENLGEETVSVSYRVYSWNSGARQVAASGCAPGCLLIAFGIAVPVVGWLL